MDIIQNYLSHTRVMLHATYITETLSHKQLKNYSVVCVRAFHLYV